jgi:hypothetical protein
MTEEYCSRMIPLKFFLQLEHKIEKREKLISAEVMPLSEP